MTQMQPLDVLGIVLEPIQIILGQIEQKLSEKAKNTKKEFNNPDTIIVNDISSFEPVLGPLGPTF